MEIRCRVSRSCGKFASRSPSSDISMKSFITPLGVIIRTYSLGDYRKLLVLPQNPVPSNNAEAHRFDKMPDSGQPGSIKDEIVNRTVEASKLNADVPEGRRRHPKASKSRRREMLRMVERLDIGRDWPPTRGMSCARRYKRVNEQNARSRANPRPPEDRSRGGSISPACIVEDPSSTKQNPSKHTQVPSVHCQGRGDAEKLRNNPVMKVHAMEPGCCGAAQKRRTGSRKC
ncbi:hypothetical protein EDD16DRAFT_1550082 [Pisolithus croceorrhizus]|nr:hypothetical protein EDD16DRAFT_1550082 [Pisolithus croceorrhizus]KAI6165260.1 hypothetical protein EDD17DRAFT_1556925 [Pisolithus thermaeus]